MEKATRDSFDFHEDTETLERMYARVVCKQQTPEIRYITCPECGQLILIIPTLRKMNEAIENHVNLHKEEQKRAILGNVKPINIRLDLANQILQKLQ
jgi:hypothetical protein